MSNTSKYDVHLVIPVTVKFTNVDATSQIDAITKVEERIDYRPLLNIQNTGISDIDYISYAEDPPIAANVDVVGDEDYSQSAWHGLDSKKQMWIRGLPDNVVAQSVILWNAVVTTESGQTHVIPVFGIKPTDDEIIAFLPQGVVSKKIEIMDPVVYPNGIPPIPAESARFKACTAG